MPRRRKPKTVNARREAAGPAVSPRNWREIATDAVGADYGGPDEAIARSYREIRDGSMPLYWALDALRGVLDREMRKTGEAGSGSIDTSDVHADLDKVPTEWFALVTAVDVLFQIKEAVKVEKHPPPGMTPRQAKGHAMRVAATLLGLTASGSGNRGPLLKRMTEMANRQISAEVRDTIERRNGLGGVDAAQQAVAAQNTKEPRAVRSADDDQRPWVDRNLPRSPSAPSPKPPDD